MRHVRLIAALFVTFVVVSGCSGDDEGLVGITFRNGVECLGEEAQFVEGDVVYVSPDGDDRHQGSTPETAFLTLARAMCNVRPGQTVRLMPGTYQESVVLGAFGSDVAPITIQGVPDGDQLPVLDGEGNRTMGLALVECTNVVVENVEFRNYTDEGLFVLLGSEITIRNNRFIANGRASIDPDMEGEGFGVSVAGTARVLIEDNEAAENGPAAERVQEGILGTGIDTYELQDAIIRSNYAHDNIGGGVLVEDGVNVVVENNRVERNELDAGGEYWDGAIWIDGGHTITLRGNTVTGNYGPGIQISDEDVQYPTASYGYVIEDNVVTGNRFGIYVWNLGECPFPRSEVVDFVNNTIKDNVERDIWCLEWPCGVGKGCD